MHLDSASLCVISVAVLLPLRAASYCPPSAHSLTTSSTRSPSPIRKGMRKQSGRPALRAAAGRSAVDLTKPPPARVSLPIAIPMPSSAPPLANGDSSGGAAGGLVDLRRVDSERAVRDEITACKDVPSFAVFVDERLDELRRARWWCFRRGMRCSTSCALRCGRKPSHSSDMGVSEWTDRPTNRESETERDGRQGHVLCVRLDCR